MNTICTKKKNTCVRERTLSGEENNIVIVLEREQQQHNNLVYKGS